jgi:hypothetical protein
MGDRNHFIEISQELKDKVFAKLPLLFAGLSPDNKQGKRLLGMFQFPSIFHQLISNGSIP